jgi:hypothetical protein
MSAMKERSVYSEEDFGSDVYINVYVPAILVHIRRSKRCVFYMFELRLARLWVFMKKFLMLARI